MTSQYEMYFTSSDLPPPTTNEEAFTWLPLMDFEDETPLTASDLAFFNALILSDEDWKTSSKATMVRNLRHIFTACVDLYNDYQTGPLVKENAESFFSIVEDYLRDTVASFPPVTDAPKRIAKLVKFFVKAFSKHHVNQGQHAHRTFIVDPGIMGLLFKIDQFHSKCTGTEEIFYAHDEVLRLCEDVYYIY
ncbi:hypothetical protein F4776DRAFT_329424 [Hypoxylon sp. NC0597]|nr:hypothetical protein F4776DRAFT_329424 [Hypoxylon sp. NC0597]